MTNVSARPARGALFALSLAMLLTSVGTSIANVALPSLARAFDASFEQVQWIVLAYLIAVTAFVVLAGRLGDVFGRRNMLIAGIVVFAAASVACALASTLLALAAARFAQGAGAAAMMTLAIAAVVDLVPADRKGSAMGLLGSVSAVGTAAGPALGGVIITAFGWRAVFVFLAVAGAIALAGALRFIPADRPTGAAGHGVANGWFALLRDRALRVSLAAIFIVSAIMMATLVVGPFYLTAGLRLTPLAAGWVMSIGPAVSALAGVPSGRLVDRYGASASMILGLASIVVGATLLAILPARLGVAGYIPALATMTAGYALFQAANNTAIMARTPARKGLASGLLALSRNLGLIAGASAFGFLYAAASAGVSAEPPGTGADVGMLATFTLAALLALVALVACWKVRPG